MLQDDTAAAPRAAADTGASCPACGQGGMIPFHTVQGVPTNSCILLDTADAARAYPTGDIVLAACPGCGFVSNIAFEPAKTEYSGRYEETQGFSPTFSRFHADLAQRLIDRHGLRGKTVLEIGCGKGEFLMLLAELGENRGIGIDPGVKPDRITGPAADRMTFIPEFYTEAHGAHPVDFVACKMTLEHIPDVAEFLATLRRGLGDRHDTTVFFQIPEALRILKTCAFEDTYYEHCSYFTPGSLARVFRAAGFDVLDLAVEYADQYLTIEARPRATGAAPRPALPEEDPPGAVTDLARTFPQRLAQAEAHWRGLVTYTVARGQRVALWGSGSKAVSFMTTLGLGEQVAGVTDINPYRQGHYMPTTGPSHPAARRVGGAEARPGDRHERRLRGRDPRRPDEVGPHPPAGLPVASDGVAGGIQAREARLRADRSARVRAGGSGRVCRRPLRSALRS